MTPLVNEIIRRKYIEFLFVHTGQHYDWNMSNIFLKELELPAPDVFLNVRSASHGVQLGRITARSEKILKKERPNVVLVEGDTNSALGVALAASKLKLPIGHVEAGCRSFDKNMPEEINRILIADLASLHFAPTINCVQNLIREGISKEQIYLTGHPIVDLLDRIKSKINKDLIAGFGLEVKKYYFVTIHREENVDDKSTLVGILSALSKLAHHSPVFFPIHPRTYKFINKFRFNRYLKNMIVTHPISYFEAISLIKHAKIILTDSGGIQQEAALLKIPCITLRANTEWVETVDHGVNFLARSEEEIIATTRKLDSEYEEVMTRFRRKGIEKIFGEPYVSTRIADILEELYFKR